MEQLKKLLKKLFELWIKKRWLTEINRAVVRYNKSRDILYQDTCVLVDLVEEYNKRYSDSPIKVKRI